MTDLEISPASPGDIPGILELQEQNLPERGGLLSVAFAENWFAAAIAAMPVIVGRRNDRVVGYLVSSPFAAHDHVPVVQAMLRAYRPAAGAYLYGPICVAESERAHGLAGRLFAALRRALPNREGVLFIRSDNAASLRAHGRMGMRRVAEFMHDGVLHLVLSYVG